MKGDDLLFAFIVVIFSLSLIFLFSLNHESLITAAQVAYIPTTDVQIQEIQNNATFSDKVNETLSSIQPSTHIPLEIYNLILYVCIALASLIFMIIEVRKLQPIEKEIREGLSKITYDFEGALKNYKNANLMLKISSPHIKKKYAEKITALYEALQQKKER